MTSPPRKPPPPTVLLVDDEAGLRRVLERFLERNGYRVLSVGTAETAYELLNAEAADALIMIAASLSSLSFFECATSRM